MLQGGLRLAAFVVLSLRLSRFCDQLVRCLGELLLSQLCLLCSLVGLLVHVLADGRRAELGCPAQHARSKVSEDSGNRRVLVPALLGTVSVKFELSRSSSSM